VAVGARADAGPVEGRSIRVPVGGEKVVALELADRDHAAPASLDGPNGAALEPAPERLRGETREFSSFRNIDQILVSR
jgi:hypothetical protein